MPHPKYLLQSLSRIRLLNKTLSRKKLSCKKEADVNFKGANIEKARIKLAKLHERIASQRAHFLHNLSARLTQEVII